MIEKIRFHNGLRLRANRVQIEKAIAMNRPSVLIADGQLLQRAAGRSIVVDTKTGKFVATIYTR